MRSMPFDLFISRAPSLSQALRPGSSQPMTRQEFSSVMASAPVAVTMRPDGDAWLRHPQDNSPWFAARLHPDGYMVLSTSYTNHRFLRNVYDLFGAGAEMARNLKAYLYEEVGDERVEKLDTFLAFDGRYLTTQTQVFKHVLERLDETCEGALEYPIGPFDIVPCYFMFHLEPTEAVPGDLPAVLARLSLPGTLPVLEKDRALVADQHGKWLTKILLRPDRKLQIWPYHGATSFAAAASCSCRVSDLLRRQYSNQTTFNGHPMDASLDAEVRARSGGLGVQFFEWAARRWPKEGNKEGDKGGKPNDASTSR
jgi:hypothetical protein